MRLLLLVLLVLTSCSLQAKLVLQPTGGAEMTADFRLSPSAREAWASLRELDSTLPTDPMDPVLLQKALGSRGQVSVTGNSTLAKLSINDLRRFVPSWTFDGDVWEGTLDRATLRRWTALTAWSQSPAVDSLLPASDAKVTEAEYRDLLVYLLGPKTADAAAKTLVADSTVTLTIVTPRPLRSAPGAVSVSENTAVYRWPLTRVLTLEPPIKIRLVF